MSHESAFLQQELEKARQNIEALKRALVGQDLTYEQSVCLDGLQIKGAKAKVK